ncbi:MAG TPA: hypothetical protein VJU87_11120 [Gemmatimonadaceae bacterium]|nr:hypothetical protein [Gemmatimonadaceae bacterium]
MPPKIAKFVGLGAFGGIVVFAAIFALILWAVFPRPTNGIDHIESAVTYIAMITMFVAVAIVHVVIGRGLLAYSKGERRLV